MSSSVALPSHAYACFEAINSRLTSSKSVPTEFDGNLTYPLFVTWNIRPKSGVGESRLRGCIGNFEAMEVGDGLKEYARISAFKDHRFDPISAKELPRLECGVSLLTDFELCDNYLDWTIGEHGIYIQFPNPALTPPVASSAIASSVNSSSTSLPSSVSPTPAPEKKTFRSISLLPKFIPPPHPNPKRLQAVMNATYLPDVMPAQGWTKTEAIDSAIRKAGYGGRVTEDLRKTVRVSRYRSERVECSYEEWQEWRATKRAV